ncbi:MAG: RHS repeat protein [Niabella sp.]|nr:RHS repeat protein [Niabella sp.]
MHYSANIGMTITIKAKEQKYYPNTIVRIIVLLVMLLLFIGRVRAQEDGTFQVLEPSPSVAELGKFGLAGADLSDGAFKTSVPVYTYKTKNLSVPITLVYTTNGLVVNKIPSRVGMDWMLVAGGSIGRTILDGQNEYDYWITYPSDWPNTNGANLYNFINGASQRNRKTVPDIFTYNFNGITGRFIRGAGNTAGDNEIFKLEQTNVKITATDPVLNTGFKIVDASGVQYLFLNSEESLTSNSCVHDPNRPWVKTAWMLSKIIHPLGDTIYFSYTSNSYTYAAGERETLTSKLSTKTEYCTTCPLTSTVPLSKKCSTQVQNHGLMLSRIYSNKQGFVDFNYAPRVDLPGEYALTSMDVYDGRVDPAGNVISSGETPVHKVLLDHEYVKSYDNSSNDHSRLFLTGAVVDDKPYSFNYYGLDGLPSRYSKSQDHYGFFNGKQNNSLIPPPSNESDYLYLKDQVSFANRSPDWTFSKKGCLSSITYPTKGIDSVMYEPHTVYRPGSYDCSNLNVTMHLKAEGTSDCKKAQVFYSEQFTLNCSRTVSIWLESNLSGKTSCLSKFYYTMAKIIPEEDYPLPVDLATVNFPYRVNNGQTGSFNTTLPPGTYILCVAVSGDAVGTGAVIYQDNNDNAPNKEVGGVRVSKVLTFASPGELPVIKKINYNVFGNPNSSGVTIDNPVYNKQLFIGNSCSPGLYNECIYNQYFSVSLNSPSYSGNHIYYPYVTEIYGENADGGYVEHEFNVSPDTRGTALVGPNLDEMPLSNYGIYNGFEKQTSYFAKRNETFKLVKQIQRNFKDDGRLSHSYPFYRFQFENSSQYNYSSGGAYYISNLAGISISRFDLLSRWIYPDSITTTEYDNSGNILSQSEKTVYDNAEHMLPTEAYKNKSDGTVDKTLYKYPHDFAGLQPYTEMINRHIWAPVVERSDYTSTTPSAPATFLSSAKTKYGFWGGSSWVSSATNQILAESIEKKTADNPAELRVFFNRYDGFSNLNEQQKNNDVKEVYLWGYNSQYPVVKITGSDWATVMSIPSLDISLLNSGTDLQRQGQLTLIRNYFSSAPQVLVSTYTYKPLVGMTSETDPAGRTTYYEYDSFGRLSLIKDDQGKVLKKICYNYAGQPVNCN